MIINIREIKALQHLAATKDVRHFLNGVLVKSDGKSITYAATDGHVMGKFQRMTDAFQPFELIIPNETISDIKLTRKMDALISLDSNEDGEWVISFGNYKIMFTEIDGTFPPRFEDLFTVTDPNEEPGQFDIGLTYKFLKVAKTMGVRCPGHFEMKHNGMEQALMSHAKLPDFYGCIMPCRFRIKGS